MTEQTLLELLREYTDRTGKTSVYSKEVFVRINGVDEKYNVMTFDGLSVKNSIQEETLENVINWASDLG